MKRLEKMPEGTSQMPELTSTFQSTIHYAVLQAEGSGQRCGRRRQHSRRDLPGRSSLTPFICCMQQGVTRLDILNYISHGISKIDPADDVLRTASTR